MTSGILFWVLSSIAADPAAVEMPVVADPRLKIELFAAEPEIVTPTGIAVDQRGRVLVVECHTHFRPANYQGPPADRIRMFKDTDGDGRADRITTFFEGTQSTMSVAIYHDGSVYVATRNEVFRLRDTDQNGQADERTTICKLETSGNYPHNGLSGFAFDFAGNVYFGMGENLGVEYKLIGSDGKSISGQEGGHIFRCHADGSGLERWATGFWNPFHLAFDAFGRLFAVDNDPDSMPPCRLLHIVHGGNYGFRFRNGRKGLHPFTAWNGQLPGTLPMVSGTGEAPSGVIAYESDQLPSEYRGDLLTTSWGDHRIERFHLEPLGASFRSTPQPVVTGRENFRPVGIALAPDGSLFISDWVDKSYEVHGKGRIWHLRAVNVPKLERPEDPRKAIHSLHRPLREEAARAMTATSDGRAQLEQLAGDDADLRVRSAAICVLSAGGQFEAAKLVVGDQGQPAAVRALAVRTLPPGVVTAKIIDDPTLSVEARCEAFESADNPALAKYYWQGATDADPFLQTAARGALARSGIVRPGMNVSQLNAAQRLACVLILRESTQPQAKAMLPDLLRDSDPAVRFAAVQWVGEDRLTEFRPQLAGVLQAGPTTQRLFEGYLAALEKLDHDKREPTDEWAGEQYVAQVLFDQMSSPAMRRWSLRALRPDHPALSIDALRKLLADADTGVQFETVRTLRESPHAERVAMLCKIASDTNTPSLLRAEAVAGLSREDDEQRKLLQELTSDADVAVRDEAIRALRSTPVEQRGLPAVDDTDGWLQLLEGPADPVAGERIFFGRAAGACSRCHQVEGRGGRIGPDLTTAGGALDRRRRIESVLRPSKEIAPQFVSWLVTTKDGRAFNGLLLEETLSGEQVYGDEKGGQVRVLATDVEARKPQSRSIMPDGLQETLTTQEFRNLLAFLGGLRGENQP